MDPDDLESWRIFFRGSGVSIFVVINKAILVAAKDHALHLKLRRDEIVCLLYRHFCPYNQSELSIPVEEINVIQPNPDAYCKNCFQVDGHQDNNRRINHDDFNLSVEPSKSFMVECNVEKKTADPANVIHGSNKETAAAGDEDRSQRVEHQDQTLLLTLAKIAAIEQSGDTGTLGSYDVYNRNNSLDHLNENTLLQDGLNKSITVEGSSNIENVGFNYFSNDKDGDLLEGLNKTVADQSVGFRKKVGFNVYSNGNPGDFCQGSQDRNEINSLDHSSENTYLQDGLNKNVTDQGNSDLVNEGFNGILNDEDIEFLEALNKTATDQSVESRKKGNFNVNSDRKLVGFCMELSKNLAENSHTAIGGEPLLSQMDDSSSERAGAMKDSINAGDETYNKVLIAKTILEDWKNQSDMILLDLLTKLRSLELNFEILKVTLIGKVVHALEKHDSKEVRKAACSLICYWKVKVNEWVHVNTPVEEAQPPAGILTVGDTVAPTCTKLSQGVEDSREKEIFSILPPENIHGSHYFRGELSFPEEELLQICTNPGRTCMSEKTREEDLHQPLPLLKTSSISERKQPPADKNELEMFGNTKIMKEKDSMRNVNDFSPRMPRNYGNRTSKVKNNASTNEFTKHRVPSSLQVHNVQKPKQTVEGQGKNKEESLFTRFDVASNSQLKPQEPAKERNIAKMELKKVRTSQSNELQKVEESKRKLQEGYNNGDYVRKQHATNILDVNHRPSNQELKRHKHHHPRREVDHI